MKPSRPSRSLALAAALALAPLAAAQDAGTGGGASPIVYFLGIVLVVAIVVLAGLLLRKPAAKEAPRVLANDEDDPTVVRVAGPRIVRLHGGVKTGAEIPVGDRPVTVGRAPGNTMTLADDDLSSHHVEFRRESGMVVVEDKGSTNGTFVNDQPLERGVVRPLEDGDRVRLSATTTLLYRSKV